MTVPLGWWLSAMKDRGMGLPLQATEKDFTMAELHQLATTFNADTYKGENIRWRGELWRVISQSPLLLEQVDG